MIFPLVLILTAAALWCDGLFSPQKSEELSGWRFVLKNRSLTVQRGGAVLWVTEPGIFAEDFLLGDIDCDGETELLLLLWKRGSFGPSRPFWVERDCGYSQHIFLYRLKEGELRPFWMSSALRPECREWRMEAPGVLYIRTRQGEDTLWGCRRWGLERLDREREAF